MPSPISAGCRRFFRSGRGRGRGRPRGGPETGRGPSPEAEPGAGLFWRGGAGAVLASCVQGVTRPRLQRRRTRPGCPASRGTERLRQGALPRAEGGWQSRPAGAPLPHAVPRRSHQFHGETRCVKTESGESPGDWWCRLSRDPASSFRCGGMMDDLQSQGPQLSGTPANTTFLPCAQVHSSRVLCFSASPKALSSACPQEFPSNLVQQSSLPFGINYSQGILQ